MHRDAAERLARLQSRGDDLAGRARRAGRAAGPAARGSDAAGAVSVALDDDGRVKAVTLAEGWRRLVGPDGLAAAVREAAGAARLAAWGEAFTDEGSVGDASCASVEDFARQLRQAATAPMSSGDGRVALQELLALTRAVERGIDEVSERIRAGLDAAYTGRSGGECRDRDGERGRRTGRDPVRPALAAPRPRGQHRAADGAAVAAAYQRAARHGVRRLIEESPLGEVQRLGQDPFGLARRLRMRD